MAIRKESGNRPKIEAVSPRAAIAGGEFQIRGSGLAKSHQPRVTLGDVPAPIVIGTGGRIPPATVIEDDATGDVETSGTFDPATDGIDFYESLEGMLVQVNDAVAVGPTSDFGSNREIPVVVDNGANAGLRTPRAREGATSRQSPG